MCHPSWTRALAEAHQVRALDRILDRIDREQRRTAGRGDAGPRRGHLDGAARGAYGRSVTSAGGIFRCRYQEK
jgi:hypothetical protein